MNEKIYRKFEYKNIQQKFSESDKEEISEILNLKLIDMGHEKINSFTYTIHVDVEETQ